MQELASPPSTGRSATSRANSRASAKKAAHYAGAQAQAVLRVIRESGLRGLTDWDICALADISRTSCCARRNALMDATPPLVVEHPDEKQRSRVAGRWSRNCTVYVSAEAARQWQNGRSK
jgi:hypothetical protein